MSAPEYTEDDFAAWMETPMTRLVIAGLEAMATEQQTNWQAGAWSAEYLNAEDRERQLIALNRAKVRADTYREMANITLADVLAANGLETAQEGQ